MKGKPDGTSERQRSDRLAFYLSVFVVAPMIGILASLPILGFCLMHAAASQLGEALGCVIAALVVWPIIASLAYLIVTCDWIGLLALLPGLLAWLRSVGLLSIAN